MSIEAFLMNLVTPQLNPGERVLAYGLLRQPTRINLFGVPQQYDDFLGVATDQRLVVFQTKTGGFMSPTAKPVAKNPIVWNYHDLAQVTVGEIRGAIVHSGGRGRALRLDPVPGRGPYPARSPAPEDVAASGRRYDVYSAIDGLPGQAQLLDQFVPWLEAQQRARAASHGAPGTFGAAQTAGAAPPTAFGGPSPSPAEDKRWRWRYSSMVGVMYGPIPVGAIVVGIGALAYFATR